jgi:hypothetical protein
VIVSAARLLCAGILCVAAAAASAQTYRWVDRATGKIRYADRAPAADEAINVEVLRSVPSVTNGDDRMSYATRQAAENFPVTLYVAAECGEECAKAGGFLRRRGIPFVEKSLLSEADVADYIKLAGGKEALVPTLMVGAHAVKGFLESSWNDLLELAGYPATGR